jgi:hypothetical protein
VTRKWATMADTFPTADWKARVDQTMEQVFKNIAETSRIMDGVERMRHEQEAAWGLRPRERHLRLVRNDDEDVGKDPRET